MAEPAVHARGVREDAEARRAQARQEREIREAIESDVHALAVPRRPRAVQRSPPSG
jgi:hypothetical protein